RLGLTGADRLDSRAQEAVEECWENTRVALLRTIDDWIHTSDAGTPPIFWLAGLAGTGKTTIAKTIAVQTSEKGILGGAFFFSRNNADQSNATLVFPSIACQLAERYRLFKSELVRVLQSRTSCESLSLQSQLRDLIVKPLRSVADVESPVVIVIDALDE